MQSSTPAHLPYLDITGPNGQHFVARLSGERLTIGRLPQFADVALQPDPQRLVSKMHCLIEQAGGGWWLVDNGSTNGTYLQRGETRERVRGRIRLFDGDIVSILAQLPDSTDPTPRYWEMIFRDPIQTVQLRVPTGSSLDYDWIQARLFRIDGGRRVEINNLRPQEHKLIRYMLERNRANGNVATLCEYEELISAIWGDEPGHTTQEVTGLVSELRTKLEIDSKKPQFLKTVRGLGYRLHADPNAG